MLSFRLKDCTSSRHPHTEDRRLNAAGSIPAEGWPNLKSKLTSLPSIGRIQARMVPNATAVGSGQINFRQLAIVLVMALGSLLFCLTPVLYPLKILVV